MKKFMFVIFFALLLFLGSSYIYKHFDELENYFSNENWKLVEVVETISVSNYYAIDGNASNLIIVGNNYMHGYSASGKENFDLNVSLKNAVTATAGDYCIVGEKDASKIYMINSNAKIWELDVQGNILDVSVNKNGYAAIVYKQVGYKSLVKVIKPDGDELFTTYLASNYAIDVEVSNDNKTLAIAEIDAEGVNVKSVIELINMNDLDSKNSSKFALDDNTLITNIEYNSKNKLVVQTDKNILILDDDNLCNFVEDFSDKTKFVSIENPDNPVTISKLDNGLFDTTYVLKIYNYKASGSTFDEYKIDEAPSVVTAQNGYIALLLEKELIIVNSNGKLVKKSDVSGSVKSVIIFNNGNALAVVHRDKVEFMKI